MKAKKTEEAGASHPDRNAGGRVCVIVGRTLQTPQITSMDTIDKQARSRLMGRIRSKDTKPEVAVRRLAHRLGFRFRLHRRDLPGSPDLVFSGPRKVVFVHGCFWHRHPGCRLAYAPKSNLAFWAKKFAANVTRDEKALADLKNQGWDSLVIWECEAKDSEFVTSRLSAYLGRTDDQ